MFHDVSEKLKGKKFLGLLVSNNMEHATTEASEVFFQNFALFMDLDHLGTIKRSTGKLVGNGKGPEKEAKYPLIKGVYTELESIGTIGDILYSSRPEKNLLFKRTTISVM